MSRFRPVAVAGIAVAVVLPACTGSSLSDSYPAVARKPPDAHTNLSDGTIPLGG